MSEGRLSTHVLDLTTGRPAAGMKIELFRLDGEGSSQRVVSVQTNADGRTDQPLLRGPEMTVGSFELIFHVGDYFKTEPATRFLDQVPVRFTVSDIQGRYHVPLLVTPWAYQTYRGS